MRAPPFVAHLGEGGSDYAMMGAGDDPFLCNLGRSERVLPRDCERASKAENRSPIALAGQCAGTRTLRMRLAIAIASDETSSP